MVFANDFSGASDNEIIESAIAARDDDGIVVISPRRSTVDPERSFWLLDRAILLPSNTVVILKNCTLKLSDRCRDNFFRTANCGIGIEYPERIKNVHIRGEGRSTLIGADHPRASGDSTKKLEVPCPYLDEDLCKYAYWIDTERRKAGKPSFDEKHDYSYGTDSGKSGESQYGDWRGIGILFANLEDFSIENLKIVESHGWAISLEECAYGSVKNIEFDARMSKKIDGMLHNMENQDGIDLRNGCHHIIVSDIMGQTGDDIIALTAIKGNEHKGGVFKTTHVMHTEWDKRESGIHDVVIRNVVGYSQLCYNIRLLACNTKIWNVVIDGVIDTSPEGHTHSGCIVIGSKDSNYGKNLPDGISNITISNVISCAKSAIKVGGYLKDSVICGLINKNPDCAAIVYAKEDSIDNVITSGVISPGNRVFEYLGG